MRLAALALVLPWLTSCTVVRIETACEGESARFEFGVVLVQTCTKKKAEGTE